MQLVVIFVFENFFWRELKLQRHHYELPTSQQNNNAVVFVNLIDAIEDLNKNCFTQNIPLL